ncbi:MAG: GFA family protein [bacterium]|nr:GFA family protein [bacterium]
MTSERSIRGHCLCEGIQFEVSDLEGPLELCHCSRCRRGSGAAFVAGIWLKSENLRWLRGRELIKSYAAPILKAPPPYRRHFCGTCGSPVPNPDPDFHMIEVPAGLLEEDPGLRPAHHLLFGPKAPWWEIRDGLP